MPSLSGTPDEAAWSQRALATLAGQPDVPAVISVDAGSIETWSGRDFVRLAAGALDLLDELEIRAGDDVPALFGSRPTSMALMLAGAVSGRPLAPLAPRMTSRELLACLANLSGDTLLTDPEWASTANDLAELTGRRLRVVQDLATSDRPVFASASPDSIAVVMHTSGTTGLPKPVRVREFPLARRTSVNAAVLDLRPGDRFATAALFHHVAALGNVAVALATGATLVSFPTFSADAWVGIEAAKPTHTVVVPSIIETLLAADALAALPSLRVLGYGGSPMRAETVRRVQNALPDVDLVNLFGQTEGSPLTVLDAADHRDAASGQADLLSSVGRAAPGVELKIHEPDPDGIGEIWARCAHSFVVDDEGWQHTGDLGRLVGDYLYLAGRLGDKIIRGGENVLPVEVEQVLESHPGVREVGVVGVPDRRLGETIVAVVVPADPSAPPSPDELHGYARKLLAGFKVPAQWVFTGSLPRNHNGKLLRRELIRLIEVTGTETDCPE